MRITEYELFLHNFEPIYSTFTHIYTIYTIWRVIFNSIYDVYVEVFSFKSYLELIT